MKNTTKIFDLFERSLTGPIMAEKDFDMKCVAGGIAKAVKKYDIKFDDEHIINQDDALADRVWEAAIEFLAECGVFHQDTSRIIKFSRQEIEDALRDAPSQVTLGNGTDAIVERWRSVDDERPPLNAGSPVGTPIANKYFVPVMQSYIKEPMVDVTTGATLETIGGMEIRTRSALEILAAWEEVQLIKHAAQMAGRPGMPYIGVQMSVSDLGHISAAGRGDYPSGYTHTLGIISELKSNNEIFNKLAHSIMQGGIIDPYANPIYGGLGGGKEGQAVLLTAEMIALSVFFMSACNGSSPTHPVFFNDTTKDLLMYQSLSYQAIARNSHILTNLTLTPVGGPGTKKLLYECVAFGAMCSKSGLTRVLGPRSATGVISGHMTGLEARFHGEVMHAATKIDRKKADEIVHKALSMYEDKIAEHEFGKPFWELYDVEKVTPNKEWLDMYQEVKEEARGWGLPL